MDRCLLLGIDLQGSPATQHALCAAGDLLELCSSRLGLVLLAVIPVPSLASRWNWEGTPRAVPSTYEQRRAAEQAVCRARATLQEQGIAPERIEALIRVGIPADELVKAAQEFQVDCILVGTRGYSPGQRVRRAFTGSTSRRVLRLASCPVMIVSHPRQERHRNLVAWYEEAVRRSLQDHPGILAVLTPREAAQRFAPPMTMMVGNEEADAAARALERLARAGVLVCHTVHGEPRYLND